MSCLRRRKLNKQKRGGKKREDGQIYSLPQELADECLSYLSSYNDLRACSLVCRSWSFPAQRLLFQVVHLSCTSRCESFEKTLRNSSHFVAHVHTLVFCPDRSSELETGAFAKIYCFPFTHLAHIWMRNACAEAVVALQPLFSMSTLRRVTLHCWFDNQTAFRTLWDNCSPSIRHLDWTLFPPPTSSRSHASTPIALESLRLIHLDYLNKFSDHNDAGRFFDFSRLAVLSARDIPSLIFAWPQIQPALQNLEALEFDAFYSINFSWFPNLLFLCIQVTLSKTAHNPLSTITLSSRIQDIVLNITYPLVLKDEFDELDSILADLPMRRPPTVGLKMEEDEYISWAPSFPRLHSKNLLRQADSGWFEAQLRRRDSPLNNV